MKRARGGGCLFDGEVRAVDALLASARVFGVDQFEVERQSAVRRQRAAHREQIGRDVDAARKRDEVGRIGQRREQTLGIALRAEERPPLTLYVADRQDTDQTHQFCSINQSINIY